MGRWGYFGSQVHGLRVRESTMKPVGKPDARNGHVRFDERGWETGRRIASVPAPILDSTPLFRRAAVRLQREPLLTVAARHAGSLSQPRA